MNETELAVERLRAALRALAEGARPGEKCPPPERLWATLRAELPVDERREVIDHMASCPSCAEAWRLAVEIHPGPLPAAAPERRSWPASLFAAPSSVPLAAAAALVVAIGAGLFVLRESGPPSKPGYREAGPSAIRSLVPEGESLPRDAFRLRWSPGPEGARYDVRVTSESLDTVASARGLTEPSYLVPESALASLPAGTRLLWQVQARLPDGERRDSPTFITSLR
jgi:hypothetical protein